MQDPDQHAPQAEQAPDNDNTFYFWLGVKIEEPKKILRLILEPSGTDGWEDELDCDIEWEMIEVANMTLRAYIGKLLQDLQSAPTLKDFDFVVENRFGDGV